MDLYILAVLLLPNTLEFDNQISDALDLPIKWLLTLKC